LLDDNKPIKADARRDGIDPDPAVGVLDVITLLAALAALHDYVDDKLEQLRDNARRKAWEQVQPDVRELEFALMQADLHRQQVKILLTEEDQSLTYDSQESRPIRFGVWKPMLSPHALEAYLRLVAQLQQTIAAARLALGKIASHVVRNRLHLSPTTRRLLLKLRMQLNELLASSQTFRRTEASLHHSLEVGRGAVRSIRRDLSGEAEVGI